MSETTYLKTACERCGGHIEYPSEMAGQSIQCPHCQHTIKLLSPPPPPQPPPTIPQSPPVKATIKRKSSLAGIGCLLRVSARSASSWLSPLSRLRLALLSLEYLVCGFCSTVAGKLHGLSAHCAAASYRIGASVFARTAMRVFNDAFATMTSPHAYRSPAPPAIISQPFSLPVKPANLKLEHSRAFLVEVCLNLQAFCPTQLAYKCFVIVNK